MIIKFIGIFLTTIMYFNMPLFYLRTGLRGSHMDDQYDFYKGNMHTNFPLVNGKLTILCYLKALYNCYVLYRKKFLSLSEIKTNTSNKYIFYLKLKINCMCLNIETYLRYEKCVRTFWWHHISFALRKASKKSIYVVNTSRCTIRCQML